jgi:hypothetical protein
MCGVNGRYRLKLYMADIKVKSIKILHTYLLTYLLTYSMEQSPSNRFHLVKKLPAFYGNGRFITAFTSARHLHLTWARSIQSILPHPTSWISSLILSSYLILGLPSGLFPSGFHTKTPFPHTRYMSRPSHSSRFYHPNIIWWAVQIIKLLIM